MDALELLKQDHQKVAELFGQVEATKSEKKHKQLFQQIKVALEAHTHIEETILYPSFVQHEELKDMTLEAYEEHKQVKTLLREIDQLAEGSERFDAKLTVMAENVEHHVKEEETEMFPKVRNHYDKRQLAQLGQEMEAAKQAFLKTTQKSSGAG